MQRIIRRYTLEERVVIQEGLDKGLSKAKIGKLINRCPSSLCHEINNRSIDGVYNAIVVHESVIERAFLKKNKSRKRFSADEIAYARECFVSGKSITVIAVELQTCVRTLKKYLFVISDYSINKRTSLGVLDRLNSLEEQIKILFETVKELRVGQISC